MFALRSPKPPMGPGFALLLAVHMGSRAFPTQFLGYLNDPASRKTTSGLGLYLRFQRVDLTLCSCLRITAKLDT
jgi:hypothetical protein